MTEQDKAELELIEKIREAIGKYTFAIMVANPTWVVDPSAAEKLAQQILIFIKKENE